MNFSTMRIMNISTSSWLLVDLNSQARVVNCSAGPSQRISTNDPNKRRNNCLLIIPLSPAKVQRHIFYSQLFNDSTN